MLDTLPRPRATPSSRLAFGRFSFDRVSRLLRRDEEVLAVPPRVLAVLELLLEHAGEVVSRQALIEAVWKDAFVTDTSLAEAVSVLRQTLGDDPQSPAFVQTVHRRGYRFIAAVNAVPSTPAVLPAPELPESRERVSPSIAGQLLPWGIAAICAAAAVAAVWQVTARSQTTPPVVTFELAPAPGTAFDAHAPSFALSPDGTLVAWSGCDAVTCRLYVRAIGQLEAVMLSGTDDAHSPFFSPDGNWIAYFAGGKLRKVAVTGGTSVPLADAADVRGGAWTRDRRIIFAGARTGLSVVGDDGADVRPLTVPNAADGEVRHAWPSLTADGRTVLFTVVTAPGGETPGRIAAMPLTTGREQPAWKSILDDAGRCQPLATDAVVFSRGTELAAIAFDGSRIGVSGTPQVIVTGVSASGAVGQFAASTSGALAYVRTVDAIATADKQPFASAALSPDGSRVAAVVRDGLRSDLWVASLDTGVTTRLTHDGANAAPVWSPDGRVVYFAKRSGGRYEIWKRTRDAALPAARVLAANGHAIPSSVSSDGETVLFTHHGADMGLDIWSVPARGGSARTLVRTPFDETAASMSADGRFLAYQSNESGRWEVHVMRVADSRRVVVSADGGVEPTWDAEAARVRYRARGRTIVAAIASDGELRVSPAGDMPEARRTPLAIDAAGRVRFSSAAPLLDRAVLTLAFDRRVRETLGPRTTAIPR